MNKMDSSGTTEHTDDSKESSSQSKGKAFVKDDQNSVEVNQNLIREKTADSLTEDDNKKDIIIIDDDDKQHEKETVKVNGLSSAHVESFPLLRDQLKIETPTSQNKTEEASIEVSLSTGNSHHDTVSTPVGLIKSPAVSSSSHSPVRSPSKKERSRVTTPKRITDNSIVLDEEDLELLRAPFKHGWKREIVYRNVTDPNNKRSLCDVYYFPPSGKKLRSMVDISGYLNANPNSPVKLTNFTFKRKQIFDEPHETVRTAGKVHRNSATRRSTEKQTSKPKTKKNPSQALSKKKDPVKLSALCSPRSSISRPSSLATTKSAKPVNTPTQHHIVAVSSSTPNLGNEVLENLSHSTKPTWSMRLADQASVQSRNRKRTRPRTPDWLPSSEESSEACSSPEREIEIIKTGLGSPGGEDQADEMQTILGTPSKLIASIVGREPLKQTPATELGGRKIRLMSRITAQSTPSMTASHSYKIPAVVATSSPGPRFQLSSTAATTIAPKACSIKCLGLEGVHPSVQCSSCHLFCHPDCAGVDKSSTQFVCNRCKPREPKIIYISESQLLSLPKVPVQGTLPKMTAQGASQVVIPISPLNTCPVGSIPAGLSPTISSSLSSSKNHLSKSLVTIPVSSSMVPQQSTCNIVYMSKPETATIPPPPPLASRPHFNISTPVMPLLGIPMPAPPRLQSAIPVHPLPPPLFPAASIIRQHQVISNALQRPITVEPPALHPRPVFILSKPASIIKSSETPPASTTQKGPTGLDNEKDATRQMKKDLSSVETLPKILNMAKEKKERKSKVKEPRSSNSTLSQLKSFIQSRTEESQSPTRDFDELDLMYPPVSFGQVNPPSDTQTSPESKMLTSSPLSPVYNKEKHRATDSSVSLPDIHSSSKTSETVLDVEGSLKTNNESASSKDGLCSSVSRNKPPSNAQLLSLPSSVLKKLNIKKPMALKINAVELIVQPCCIMSSTNDLKVLLPAGTFQPPSDPSAKLNVAISNDLSTVSVVEPTSQNCPHSSIDFETTAELTPKSYLRSFRMLHSSFLIIVKIFEHLSTFDLLRARRVCRLWNRIALQQCLWQDVHMNRIVVKNWHLACIFFNKVGVKSLDLRGIVLHAQRRYDGLRLDDMMKNIPIIKSLKRLFFSQVPASVLHTITEQMPQLENVTAECIQDVVTHVPCSSKRNVTKRVEDMTKAVEAVTTGEMTAPIAASCYDVSEQDLIYLSQTSNTNNKLTEDEERTVVLCCLRLSRMGFSVNMSTVMSKCQEMFARRYSTSLTIPISDKYCKDLFYQNLPHLIHVNDLKSSDYLDTRLAAHFKALRRLHNSFLPRRPLSTNQVLAFDVKTYSLVRDSSGMNVSLLSAMSAQRHFLPVMLIQPTYIHSKHSFLITAEANHGNPTINLVYLYIKKVLTFVKERPVVIMCNGHVSLLSEKLISSCVSDSVHFHCVPPDIAHFVFPSFHGGLGYMLQTQISTENATPSEFEDCLYKLLNSKDKVTQSVRHAMAATGVSPFNANAPSQFQNINLKATPNRQKIQSMSAEATATRTGKLSDIFRNEEAAEIFGNSYSSMSTSSDCDENKGSSNIIKGGKRTYVIMQESKTTTQENDTKLSSLRRKNSTKPNFTQSLARSLINRAKKFQKDHLIITAQRSSTAGTNPQAISPAHQSKNNTSDSNGKTGEAKNRKIISLAPSTVVNDESSSTNQVLASNSRHQTVRKSQRKMPMKLDNEATKFKVLDFLRERALRHSQNIEDTIDQVIADSRAVYEQKHSVDKFLNSAVGTKHKSIKSLKRKLSPDLQPQQGCKLSYFRPLEESSSRSTECTSQSSESVNPLTESSSRLTESSSQATEDGGNLEKVGELNSGSNDMQQEAAFENKISCSKGISETDSIAKTALKSTEKVTKGKRETQKWEGVEVIMEESGKRMDGHHEEALGDEKVDENMPTSHGLGTEVIQTKKQKKEKRKKRERDALIINDQESDVDEKKEEDMSQVKKKRKHKKKKKHKNKRKKKEKQINVDNLGEEATQSVEDHSENEKEEVIKSDHEDGEGKKIVRLRRLSLMDHDYFKKSDDFTEENANVEEKMEESSETNLASVSIITDAQNEKIEEESKSEPPNCDLEEVEVEIEDEGKNVTLTTSLSSAQEIIVGTDSVETDSDSDSDSISSSDIISDTESELDSGSSKSKSDGGKSHSDSSSSSDKDSDSNDSAEDETESKLSSPQKPDEASSNTQSKDDFSSSDSQVSDEDEESDEGNESVDNEEVSSTSEEGDDLEEEDDEEDDDSKCQMCMRASPPHSKDMIIDWVDCDGNCGRWFHVICILRSKAKANFKHFVCPSCSCKR